MFHIHTTMPATTLRAKGLTIREPIEDGDCFYGWGEAPDRPGCEAHVIVPAASYDLAAGLARTLIREGFYTVITDAEDWSKVIAGDAIYFIAEHDH